MRRGPVLEDQTGMTQYMCVKECKKFGYEFAGLEVNLLHYERKLLFI